MVMMSQSLFSIDHYDTATCHWSGGGATSPFLWVGSNSELQSGEMGSAHF